MGLGSVALECLCDIQLRIKRVWHTDPSPGCNSCINLNIGEWNGINALLQSTTTLHSRMCITTIA